MVGVAGCIHVVSLDLVVTTSLKITTAGQHFARLQSAIVTSFLATLLNCEVVDNKGIPFKHTPQNSWNEQFTRHPTGKVYIKNRIHDHVQQA